MRAALYILLVVVVVVAVVYGPRWYGASERSPAAVVPSPEAVTPAPTPRRAPMPPSTPATQVAPALPELNASDPFVLEQLDGLALPQPWLDRDDLIRRLAVVIDNAARGEYPRRQLGFLAPTGKFSVIERGDRLFVDPHGYARYDGYLDVLESIEPAVFVGTIWRFEPLISTALAELGNQQSVDEQLDSAILQIFGVPVLPEQVELVQPKVLYEYADSELEALSPLQKQVLRMGPDNVRRLQAYLERLQEARADPSGYAGATSTRPIK